MPDPQLQERGSLRLAYADPPYPGQSKRHYGDHPDYAGEVDHEELLQRLTKYDGWALSTSNRALADVLALTGPQRVLAWCKPIAPPFPKQGVFGWEPVIVSWARPPASDLRDTLTVSPEQYTFRPKPEGYVTGSKPPAFCRWLFNWLGARVGDDFTDLFPGSRAVSDAWVTFNAAPTLEVAAECPDRAGIDYTGWDFDQINADAEHYRRWRRGEVPTCFDGEADRA